MIKHYNHIVCIFLKEEKRDTFELHIVEMKRKEKNKANKR